jgi:hypothetical protein
MDDAAALRGVLAAAATTAPRAPRSVPLRSRGELETLLARARERAADHLAASGLLDDE